MTKLSFILSILLLSVCSFAQKINLPTQVRGQLPCGNMPALTGSVTTSAGTCVTTGGGFTGAVFAASGTTVQQAINAGSTNGMTIVPSNYAGGDIPSGTQVNDIYIPSSSAQPDGSHVIDYRNGGFVVSLFNPGTSSVSPGNISIPSGVIGNFTKLASAATGYNEFMFGVQQNAYDGGSNLFGTAGSSNKTTYAPLTSFLNAWTPGQHIGGGVTVNGYGAGDNLAWNMVANCWGGSNARSDEGCHLGDWALQSGNVAYVGSVSSGGTAGSTSVTISPSAGSGTQGAGRFLLDTTSGSAITITTITGAGPLTYTASTTPFTTATTTTDSTAISTPGSTLINVGSTTGITANTTLVAIYDNQSSECVKPTAVSAGVSITAVFRRTYASGANLAWGSPQVCQFISLDADRWTTTGAIAFTNVLNTLRQAWLIVGAPSTSTLTVWYNTGGGYGTYGGNAKASAGSNAATIYPGAEVISVQSGGTVSNILTLAPNTVTFSTHAVEEPLYPGQKMILNNLQIFKAFHSAGSQGFGGGFTANGNFNGGDCFACYTDNAPNTLYLNHGGNENPPIAAFYFVKGLVRNGLAFDELPDTALISSGCPVNSSGTVDCTLNNDNNYKVIALNASNFWAWNPSNGSFRLVAGNGTVGYKWDGATGNFTAQNGGMQTAAALFSAIGTCNSGNEGLMRSVTDSTTAVWGATITGSSTNHVMAYCDGTAWTVAAK